MLNAILWHTLNVYMLKYSAIGVAHIFRHQNSGMGGLAIDEGGSGEKDVNILMRNQNCVSNF